MLWNIDMGTKIVKINKDTKIQKHAICVITNSRYSAYNEPLLKRLNVLKVEDLHKLQIYKLIHKITNQNVPQYFQNLEIENTTERHSYNIRQYNRYLNNFYRKTLTKNCTREHIINTLKNTDQNISSKFNTHSIGGFSQYAKNYIITDYKITCTTQNCFTCQNLNV